MMYIYITRSRRAEAGQQAAWLSEYRRVFIMFVKLPAIDYEKVNVMVLLQVCHAHNILNIHI